MNNTVGIVVDLCKVPRFFLLQVHHFLSVVRYAASGVPPVEYIIVNLTAYFYTFSEQYVCAPQKHLYSWLPENPANAFTALSVVSSGTVSGILALNVANICSMASQVNILVSSTLKALRPLKIPMSLLDSLQIILPSVTE